MEQDWKEKLKAEILEDMKREAIREWTEEKAKILMEERIGMMTRLLKLLVLR